jgi:hypothetical protein
VVELLKEFKMEFGEIIRCIEEEPELPDTPPPELLETLEKALKNKDVYLVTECFRIVVRLTKEGIKNRVINLSKEYTLR